MIPKGGFKKNIDILPKKEGFAQRLELLHGITKNQPALPKGITYEDLDTSFIDFVNKDLALDINGEMVPIIFLTIQRWAEYARTWKFTDEYKNIKLPFITIVRKPDVQAGTDQSGLWNIPGVPLFTYMKVPTFNGGRAGVDLYKIPQPTAVDLRYEVRLFCNKMRDLNKFNLQVQEAFRSRQFYINPAGHPMPLVLESVADESVISDFEQRRFYVQNFEILLKAYVLDEQEFKVVPMPNRVLALIELCSPAKQPVVNTTIADNSTIKIDIVSLAASPLTFSIIAQYNMVINDLILVKNIAEVDVSVDTVPFTVPFSVTAGQTIGFTLTKSYHLTGEFILLGNMS
jgi:hypothetical protein